MVGAYQYFFQDLVQNLVYLEQLHHCTIALYAYVVRRGHTMNNVSLMCCLDMTLSYYVHRIS